MCRFFHDEIPAATADLNSETGRSTSKETLLPSLCSCLITVDSSKIYAPTSLTHTHTRQSHEIRSFAAVVSYMTEGMTLESGGEGKGRQQTPGLVRQSDLPSPGLDPDLSTGVQMASPSWQKDGVLEHSTPSCSGECTFPSPEWNRSCKIDHQCRL